MSLQLDHLPASVGRQIRAFYRRKRALSLLRLVATVGSLYLLLVLAAVHIDRFWLLTQADRVLLFQSVHGAVALFAGVLLLLWRRGGGSTTALAYELERNLGQDINEQIVTLHSLSQPGADSGQHSAMHQQLLAHLRQSTESVSQSLNAAAGARDPRLKARLVTLAVLACVHLLLVAPASYQYGLMLQRFLQPRADLAKPSFVQLTVEPEALVVGLGGEAVIQAETEGRMPAIVAWIMTRLGTATHQCEIAFGPLGDDELLFEPANTEAMTRIQRTLYLYSRGDLQASFRFRIRYGDAVTRTHEVRVVPQPRVTRIAVAVTPPAYSGLPQETLDGAAGPLAFLAQSAVTVTFTVDQPTTEQILRAAGDEEPLEMAWDAATRSATYSFSMEKPVTLNLTVTNADGFANVDKAEVLIGLRQDEPPSVRLESPTADLDRVPGDLVPLRLVLEDDLGLTEAAIRYQLNPTRNPDASFQELPLDLGETPGKRLELNPSFDLDATGATPGDEILVQIRARDSAGNDGQTRPLIIRVVAFTRGENERRRLQVLSFLRDSLDAVATLPEGAAAATLAGGAAIDSTAWERITQAAEAADVELSSVAGMAALLQVLEYEVHFTDRPRHKDDLRLLYGRLLQITATAPDAAGRAAALRPLVDDTLPRLMAARRLQNLATRLFGMEAEAADIRDTLADLSAEGAVEDKDRERAVKRRAELFLQVLQDLGDELIGLAESQPDLDAEKVLSIQGELNTQAYYMTRGSLARRQEGVQEVTVLLAQLGALLAPPLPRQIAGELAARRELQQASDALYAAGAMSDDWLRADGRLLDLNPFVTQYERARNLGLLQARLRGQAPAAAIAAAQAAAQTQRQMQAALASQWEWQTFGAAADVPARERLFVAWAMRLTQDWQAAPPDHRSLAATTQQFIAAMADPAAAGLPPTARLVDQATPPLVPGLVQTPDLHALISHLLDRLAAADTASQTIRDAMLADQAEHPEAAIATLDDAMRLTDQDLALAVDLLSYGQRFEPDLDADPTAAAYATLRLQAAHLRYQQQSLAGLDLLAQARTARPDAGKLAQLQAELTRMGVVRAALATILQQVRDEAPDLDEALQRYPILADYRRSATRLRLARAAAAGQTPAPELAAAYLAAFPQAGMDYLAAQTRPVDALVDTLATCQDLLEPATPDLAAYRRSLLQADTAITALQAIAAQAGDSEDAAAIRENLDTIAVRVQRLAVDGSPSANILRRKLFDLTETLPLATRLQRDLQGYQLDRTADADGYRGGPAGIWDDPTHSHAEVARRRLHGQVLTAADAVTASILGGQTQNADTDPANGAAWALVLHRVQRSPLAGPVRVQPKRGDTDRGADKFIDWLQQHIADARKVVSNRDLPETYDTITLEYLNSLSDFLRY